MDWLKLAKAEVETAWASDKERRDMERSFTRLIQAAILISIAEELHAITEVLRKMNARAEAEKEYHVRDVRIDGTDKGEKCTTTPKF